VLTGSADRTARLWDARTGQPLQSPFVHDDAVIRVALSPDGRTALTVTTPLAEATIRFWDVATGKPIGPAIQGPGSIQSVTFSRDRRTGLTSWSGCVQGWEVPSVPVEGPVERLRLWAQTITPRELDAAGVAGWQTPEAWRQRRQEVVRGGPLFNEPRVADRGPILWEPCDPGAFNRQGLVFLHLGRTAEAIAEFRKGIEIQPSNPASLNNLAWVLATCREVSCRDPGRAVDLAQRAVKLTPRNYAYWHTLGVAYHRTARWEEARVALEKSCQLETTTNGKGNAWQWLWLSMVHWQLGHKDEARSWYDKAIKLETVWPEELRRFRTEAEEVLELKKK
jgi:hypothetical protein